MKHERVHVCFWHLSEIAALSVHWGLKQTLRCEHRDLILTRSECVRSSPWWGVVKSLGYYRRGPVGLIHTQKFQFFWTKNPSATWLSVSGLRILPLWRRKCRKSPASCRIIPVFGRPRPETVISSRR